MPFKMGMKKEDLSGPKAAAPGMYELQTVNFRPKVAKSGESLNYNVEMQIVNHPTEDGKRVFHPLNTSFFTAIRDYCHANGVECETKTVDGEEILVFPGMFENQDQFPDEPEKWGKYLGPLTNKICKAELTVTPGYQGRPDKNEVVMFICSIPGCAVKEPELRHSTSLIRKG